MATTSAVAAAAREAALVALLAQWLEERGERCPLSASVLEADSTFLYCPSDLCPWSALPFGAGPGYRFVLWKPGLPESCENGHRHAWALRKVAGRQDLFCVHGREEREDVPCADTVSIGQVPQGFLKRPGVELNGSKKMVLGALTHFEEGGASIGELIAEIGSMTRGQVGGAIRRCVEQRLIAQSQRTIVPPGVMGRQYSLTPAGQRWVRWALKVGLYGDSRKG